MMHRPVLFQPFEISGSVNLAIIGAIQTIFKKKFDEFLFWTDFKRGVTFFGLLASNSDAKDDIAAIDAINKHFSDIHSEAKYGALSKANEILFTNIIREKHSIDRHHQENTYGGRWGLMNDPLSVKIKEAITECIRKKYISQDEIDRITSQIISPELAPS